MGILRAFHISVQLGENCPGLSVWPIGLDRIRREPHLERQLHRRVMMGERRGGREVAENGLLLTWLLFFSGRPLIGPHDRGLFQMIWPVSAL